MSKARELIPVRSFARTRTGAPSVSLYRMMPCRSQVQAGFRHQARQKGVETIREDPVLHLDQAWSRRGPGGAAKSTAPRMTRPWLAGEADPGVAA